jgi:colanic acid/amylovoran biosynthesis glycosyltransferase
MLFIAELVCLAVPFNTGADLGRTSQGQFLFWLQHGFRPALITALALIFFGWASPDELRETVQWPGDNWNAGKWLALHFVIIIPLAIGSAVERPGRIDSMAAGEAWIVCWVLLGSAAIITLVLSAFPTGFWKQWLIRSRAQIPKAAALGAVAYFIGNWAEHFWGLLERSTFELTALLLKSIGVLVQSDPVQRVITARGFAVQIAPACSGIEGIGLVIVFLSAYLWFFRAQLRFPHVLLLFPMGIFVIWLLNGFRIAALVVIGNWSPEVALRGFHSVAGWFFFNGVACGLVIVSRRVDFFHYPTGNPNCAPASLYSLPEKPAVLPATDAPARVSPASMRPVRLGYLVSEYPAVSHTFILREVRRLRALNSELHVASIRRCSRPSSQMTAEEREEAAVTYYIKSAGLWGALRAHSVILPRTPVKYFKGLWFALRLAGADLKRLFFTTCYFIESVMLGYWMETRQLDHVHVHFANPAAQVALIASRIFPIHFSLTVHGPDEFYDSRGQNLAEKIAGASFVCCISQFAISQLMLVSPPSQWHKFELAPLGVDPEVFSPRLFRSAPDPFEILCVGRLVAAKGQHVLLDALDRLIRKGINVRLRLVGDGPQRRSLEQEVLERGLTTHVIFEGNVNQERIREFYRTADAFVLASFAEGVPVVLMEAMAMEIPCIATYVGGIPQLMSNNFEGLLVPPADSQALVRAIKRLILDPDLRNRLGSAGRTRVIDQYNLESNVERLWGIFCARLSVHGSAELMGA